MPTCRCSKPGPKPGFGQDRSDGIWTLLSIRLRLLVVTWVSTVFKSGKKTHLFSTAKLLTCFARASEATALWRSTNVLFIIIIINEQRKTLNMRITFNIRAGFFEDTFSVWSIQPLSVCRNVGQGHREWGDRKLRIVDDADSLSIHRSVPRL